MSVFHIQASDMGEGYTEEDMTSYQDAIEAELAAAGIDDDVYVVGRAQNFIPLHREDIRECVDRAWDTWLNGPHNEWKCCKACGDQVLYLSQGGYCTECDNELAADYLSGGMGD